MPHGTHLVVVFFCLYLLLRRLISHKYFTIFTGADTADREYTAVFCSSSKIKITFMNVNIVNEGIILMPITYGNQSDLQTCKVTIRGLQNAIIISKHQRLNASSGPCLDNRVIDNNNQEGPCPEQKVYSASMTEIALEVGIPFQPGFVISFKGEIA